jgi:hypothetical protein
MNIVRAQWIVALSLGIFACWYHLASAGEIAAPDHDHATLKAEKIDKALASLSAEDQKLAEDQRFCPLHVYRRLGATGTPVKVATSGAPFFVCGKECAERASKGGAATRRIANGLVKSAARLAKLPAEERAAAEAQKYCPIMSTRLLGTMGAPIKLTLDGKSVYLCCPDCVADAKANPAETAARAEQLKLRKVDMKKRHNHHGHHKHAEHSGKE